MTRRAAKAALLLAEIGAILLAVLAAGFVFLFFALRNGPVSLGFFKPSIEFAIERRLPKGYDASLGELTLVQRDSELRLTIDDFALVNRDGDEIATATRMNALFNAGDILKGKTGPRIIVASGAAFRIIRDSERVVKIPAARGRGGRSLLARSQSLFDFGLLQSAFERAEMVNAQVTFFDEASARSWVSNNAAVVIARDETGVTGELKGDIDVDGVQAGLRASAKYLEAEKTISVAATGENFPAGDILSTLYGQGGNIIDAPVSGQANIEMSESGQVRASHFSARVESGNMNLRGIVAPIRFVEWRADFDPANNRFDLDFFKYDIGGNSGEISGDVSLEFGDDFRDPEQVRFNLAVEKAIVSNEQLISPIEMHAGAVSGAYAVETRELSVDQFSAAAGEIKFSGNGIFRAKRDGVTSVEPMVSAAVKVDGVLDPQSLLKFWPVNLADGVRRWIDGRMPHAKISNIDAKIALPAAPDPETPGLPEDAIHVTFDVKGATAFYVPGMTPITGASGHGVLKGNSFFLSVDRARVGDIALSKGEVDFPAFKPKYQPSYYRFTASGRSDDMLGVLNEAPLNLLSKSNLDPGQFSGDATARVEIMRPAKTIVAPEDIKYRGQATFENMTVSGVAASGDLHGVKGAVDLKPRSMVVTAMAPFNERMIDIEWRQNFFANQDGPGFVSLKGVLDPALADLFGFSVRKFLRGPATISAVATGAPGAFERLEVEADFAESTLSVEALDWTKPAGAPARGEMRVDLADGRVTIDSLKLEAPDARIDGSAMFADGVMQTAAFPAFRLGNAADFALTAQRRPSGDLAIIATGKRMNLGPAIKAYLDEPRTGGDRDGGIWGNGVALTLRLDEISLRENVFYRDISLDLHRDAAALQSLQFSALNDQGAPLKATLVQTGADSGPEQMIEARSSNLGRFIKGVFGYSSIDGGEGSMTLSFADRDRPGVTGVIEARKMHVVDAPLLARIFSAGSLDGLSNLLNGEGIDLNYAYGKFDYRTDKLVIKEFRASGPSVGLTAEGEISLAGHGAVALQGAIAPLYQLNSALQGAPIIGDILVGKQGEGMLALAYQVNGERSSPSVSVNPLSALAPGVFRQLFQPEARPQVEDNTEPATESE